jgi:hypothetical protein
MEENNGTVNQYDDEQTNRKISDEGNEAPRDSEMPAKMRNKHVLPAPSKGTDVKPAGY